MRLWILLALMLLAACGEASVPPPPPTPTPLRFTPLAEALALAASAPGGADLTTAGYLVVDRTGARLVDGLSFSAGTTPQPLASLEEQIWLAADAANTLESRLYPAGDLRYAVVLARGRLEGPGAYGPGGSYRYQLRDPSVQALAPQETTIAVLLENPAAYDGRLVRIVGALLARDDAALLVERLGAGGLPEPGARQIKVHTPLRDRALIERLQSASGGAVRFGQVQIEGFWRNGILLPLSILPVS
jgi:hypothetical protein